ncbi:sensor histidine kinase [Micromonospora sp. CPCC 206061]|uniref:sensor histidine kinase n=1 Tax=Micromonospora sp. CPCC 206061 TaxID=3122410 RepID=UPI002FF404FA
MRAPRRVDAVVVGGLALATAGLWYEDYRAVEVEAVAALALRLATVLPLIWLRTRPWPVLLAVAGAQVGCGVVERGDTISQGPLFVAVAVYGVACYTSAPRSLRALPVGAIAVVASLLLSDLDGGGSGPPDPVVVLVLPAVVLCVVGVAWLLGSGRRRIVSDARQLRRLAAQLRTEREISERRAVRAERARIAADLHDIVAHHVSAIAVQANATAELLADGDESPDGSHARVGRIAVTADAALVEMRRMLGLLADPWDRSAAPDEPSLAHLDRLGRVAEAAGCQLRVNVEPAVTAAPGSLQICAYRIVQEALTNVVKHAGGTTVDVDLRCEAGGLVVTVENGPPAPRHRLVGGSGMGIVGMRERVAVFGGSLRTGRRDDGGWRVAATLPIGTDNGSRLD